MEKSMKENVKKSIENFEKAKYRFSETFYTGGYKSKKWIVFEFDGNSYFVHYYQNMGTMKSEISREYFELHVNNNLELNWDTIEIEIIS